MADGYLNFDTKINEKGFNEGISKLSNLGKAGLKVATGAIATLGAAVGAGMTAVVKVGAAFESEMSKVSAISGATGDGVGTQIYHALMELPTEPPHEGED